MTYTWKSNSAEAVAQIGVLLKCVLKNFAKFTEKHRFQGLFFNIKLLAASCSFIKKETGAEAFFCELCEIFKNIFLNRTPVVSSYSFTEE